MKKLFIITSCLFFLSCSQNVPEEIPEEYICECCEEPQENLPWLKELIEKAKADTVVHVAGHYWGCIWLAKFKGQDIFITTMALGSGAARYWAFDCSGNHLITKRVEYKPCPACNHVGNHHHVIEDKEMDELSLFVAKWTFDVLIYTSFSVPCNEFSSYE